MSLTYAAQERKNSSPPAGHISDFIEDDGSDYWGDAKIIPPGYNPDTDPNLQRPFNFSQGARSDAKRWKSKTLPLGAFLAQLAQHQEGPKDGPAFVAAELVDGSRALTAVKAVWAVGLDLDRGAPLEDVSAAVADLGVLAMAHTTHSNMTGRVEVLQDRLAKFAGERDYETDEVCRDYLRQEGYHPSVVESAQYVETTHGRGGIVVVISTAPIPKSRVIFPLAEPYVIADEGKTQREALERWRLIPQTLAGMLGLEIDRTGCDPNRLFYYPRHAKGVEDYAAAIFRGPLLDWRTLDLPAPAAGNRAKKGPTTDAGRALLGWARDYATGFQIADAIRDHAEERTRDGSAHLCIECPFDDEHSTAGDPDDRACIAINAGDGTSKRFVVTCRHDSCSERDNLDMLGKMLADGWFVEEVLTADAYNPLPDGAAVVPAHDEGAAANGRRDDARRSYQTAIDSLTPQSTDEESDRAADLIVAAELSARGLEEAGKTLRAKLGCSAPTARAMLDEAKARLAAEAPAPAGKRSASKVDWQSRLNVNADTGAIRNTLPNLCLLIENDPRTKGIVALNEFTGETVLRCQPGRAEGDGALQLDADVWRVADEINGDLWTDKHDVGLRLILETPEDEGGYGLSSVAARDLADAVDFVAQGNPFHPVRDYLRGLKWDEIKRVESLFTKYLGAEDNAYHRKAAWLFCVGAVTRAFEPGHKFDESPILEGLQGGRKTTFVETLAVHWYGELTASWEDTKAVVEQTQGVWIAELGELTGMSRADIRAVKSGLSRHTDKVRLAYAHRAQEFPRSWVCMGSTNDSAYLRDPTGGRRFLPVACKVESIPIERLRGEVDQIWAEAYHLYCELREAQPAGRLPLWLSDEEARAIAKKLQTSRTIDTAEDALEGEVREWLDAGKLKKVCLLQVWVECLERDRRDYKNADAASLRQVMHSVDWESTGERSTFGGYGQQREFVRKPTAAEPKAADTPA